MRIISACCVAAAVLAPMAGAASQETEGPTGIRTVIRDSAGIRIIENGRPPEGFAAGLAARTGAAGLHRQDAGRGSLSL